MKTLGLEKILMASSIWESFLSSSIRLFCMLRVSARTGSITRSFISCSWPVKKQNREKIKLCKWKSKEIHPFPNAMTSSSVLKVVAAQDLEYPSFYSKLSWMRT